MCTGGMRTFAPSVLLFCGAVTALTAGCSPMSGYVNNERGSAYYSSGNYVAARDEFQRAVADSPHNANYLHNLATAMKKQGDVGGAEQVYRQAIQVDPAHQPSYHGLSAMLVEQSRIAEAKDVTQMWVDTQPYNAESYIEMAWVQRHLGDAAGAERTLQQAQQVDPSNHMISAQLGQIYQDMGRSQEALAMYQRSLHKNWHQPEVQSRMATLQRTTPPLMGAPRTVQYGPSAPQNRTAAAPFGERATLLYPLPSYRSSTGTPTLAQPLPTPVPMRANADPAHAPALSQLDTPAVRPF